MRIFIVDENAAAREALARAVAAAAPDAVVQAFAGAGEAIRALRDGAARPDAILSAVEMPEMSGLELVARLGREDMEIPVVLVAADARWALEAFRVHARGYVLSPVTPERIAEELDAVCPRRSRRLEVRCFGAFDVFWQGRPLTFRRRQTRELLAYLVDRRGSACTAGEIITALWENGRGIADPRAYLRALTSDLRATLARIGMQDVLVREHRQWAVERRLLDCDYYRLLEGDPEAEKSFRGEYMNQYSWAETTRADLYFRNN